jgi:outer membrane receptor protein involved in Fe transport
LRISGIDTPVELNVAGTSRAPPLWSGTGFLRYRFRNVDLTWTLHHFSAYGVEDSALLNAAQGDSGVRAQTYHDLDLMWYPRTEAHRYSLSVQLAVSNILNKVPPIDLTATDFAYYSRYGDPRGLTYQLTLGVRF